MKTLFRISILAMFAAAPGFAACSGDDSGAGDAAPDAGADTTAVDAPIEADEASVDAGTISFKTTGTLHVARSAHTATLLPNGKVVVIGGEDAARNELDSIEIYDPATETWTELGHLPAPRSNHTATLLGNGKILVVGGGDTDPNGIPAGTNVTASAVLVDPAADDAGALVTATDSLAIGRSHHIAALLPNGNVLVAGGSRALGDAGGQPPPLDEAEIYDTTSGTWSVASSKLSVARAMAASSIVSGKVFVVGGYSSTGLTPPSYDVFDPTTQTFAAGGSLASGGRVYAALATLAGGSSAVLVGGIEFTTNGGNFFDEAERFTAGAWESSGAIGGTRDGISVVALPDGRAVAIAGFTDEPTYAAVSTVATFVPSENAWYTTGTLKYARFGQSATLLQDGRILVAGGTGPAGAIAVCEISSVP